MSETSIHRRLHEQKYSTAKSKPLGSHKNRMAKLQLAKKCLKEPAEFWKKVLWTEETKMNLYQSDGKKKVWRRKGTAPDPKPTSSCVSTRVYMVVGV